MLSFPSCPSCAVKRPSLPSSLRSARRPRCSFRLTTEVRAEPRQALNRKRRLSATLAIAAVVIMATTNSAAASVRITDDHGGNIGEYWSRYTALRDFGEQIVIDGKCSSACTMVLGIVPHDRICVTANAVLGFHAAWRPGFLGIPVINQPATQALWNMYPIPIRQWIVRNGGLGLATIYLSGPELFAMYRQCR